MSKFFKVAKSNLPAKFSLSTGIRQGLRSFDTGKAGKHSKSFFRGAMKNLKIPAPVIGAIAGAAFYGGLASLPPTKTQRKLHKIGKPGEEYPSTTKRMLKGVAIGIPTGAYVGWNVKRIKAMGGFRTKPKPAHKRKDSITSHLGRMGFTKKQMMAASHPDFRKSFTNLTKKENTKLNLLLEEVKRM
jgi:hypothetical protein